MNTDINKEEMETMRKILAKKLTALTDADKAYLRARKAYLGEKRMARYAAVLVEPKAKRK